MILPQCRLAHYTLADKLQMHCPKAIQHIELVFQTLAFRILFSKIGKLRILLLENQEIPYFVFRKSGNSVFSFLWPRDNESTLQEFRILPFRKSGIPYFRFRKSGIPYFRLDAVFSFGIPAMQQRIALCCARPSVEHRNSGSVAWRCLF